MLFLVLEACAVTRACLDGQAYEELCRHPELRTLEKTGLHVLSELATAVGAGRGTAITEDEPGREGVPTVEEPARWRQRYESTLRRLQGAGGRRFLARGRDLSQSRRSMGVPLPLPG